MHSVSLEFASLTVAELEQIFFIYFFLIHGLRGIPRLASGSIRQHFVNKQMKIFFNAIFTPTRMHSFEFFWSL